MSWFKILVWSWIGVAIITFLVLLISKIRAPYGRHASKNWGKLIENKWGWFLMELPALLIFPLLAIFGPREKDILSWILIGLWSLHYINRTIIFPFRLKTKGKKIPLTIVASALFFNAVNGFVNGYYLGFEAPVDTSYLQIHVWIGLGIYFIGMFINIGTDNRLIALRERGDGYQIPRGWLFNYISCPNHFGEIIEWIGFAIVAWNLPAASFAIWTVSNLVPRALNHHDWYKERFADYPKERKAVIPYLW